MWDFDSIYIGANGDTFAAGKRYFYDNKVLGASGADNNGNFEITGIVEGKKSHEVSISFKDDGSLFRYGCDCAFHLENSLPCKHVVALALSYEEKYPQHPLASKSFERDRTDAIALTLCSEYARKKRKNSFASDEDKVLIVPSLKYEDGGRLRLKIIINISGREYVVKSLTEFLTAVEDGAYKQYGVGFGFEHNFNSFTASSQALLSFLMTAHSERADDIKMLASVQKPSTREGMLLSFGDVDDFIELFKGRTVMFDDSEIKDSMRLVEKEDNSLNVTLHAEKVKGGFVVTGGYNAMQSTKSTVLNTSQSQKFNIVTGRKFDYIVTSSRVHRVDKEFVEAVMPLVRAFWSFKKLYVTNADMPYFYNSVLSPVLKFVSLETDEGVDLSVFEAAPLSAMLMVGIQDRVGLKAELKCAYEDEPVDILSDRTASPVVRDFDEEDALLECIKKYFPHYPELILTTNEEIYEFLSEGVSKILSFAKVYLEDGVRRMRKNRPVRIKVGVRIESNLLKVDFNSDELSKEDLALILKSYSERRKYVRLLDGTFVDLSDSSVAALTQRFDIPNEFDGTLSLPKFYAPYLNSVLSEGFFNLERDKSFKDLIKELNNVRDADIEVPLALKDVMRSYQKTGFRWLSTLAKFDFGGVLADDMGLGKSLQVIAVLCQSKRSHPSIIVCPTTLTLNWVNEINKFAPNLKIATISGNSEERKERLEKIGDTDIVITSYELLRRDSELYKNLKFEFAIADEAQYIKNPGTKNAKAIKELKASYRFALTGTPIENSLSELWSIFDFVMPGYLDSYVEFKERFEEEIALGKKEAAEKLKNLVSPFVLRRLKSQVLTELPGKMEIEVEAPLENEQKDLYSANLALVKSSILAAGQEVNKITALSMLTKLRQICCEPSLVYKDYVGNSAKFDTCLELVREAVDGGHKVLLFSQFTSMLDIIRLKLVKDGITHYVLKGDTPKNERLKLVKRFNEDETNVFLISLKAGGTGLNLTGADVVIHYDPWWNESVMNQATDRAYRIGQDKPVQVYKLILKDTLEERIIDLQKQKSSLSDLILGEGGYNSNVSLSYEQILDILK